MGIARIITIDGPSASGKSTIGKRLAECLGYLYFDTGVMYRALTWAAIQKRLAFEDEEALAQLASSTQIEIQPPSIQDGRSCDVIVNGQDVTWEIRSPDVDASVSIISAHPKVREALTVHQRRIGLRGRVVMVGRDIGTVVLPEADLKIYLEASEEVRARRRFIELSNRGEEVTLEMILKSMHNRDRIDSTRKVAPLKPAHDAVIIETDDLSTDQVLERIKVLLRQNCDP